MNLLTAGVTHGLIKATSYSKKMGVTMDVYQRAKDKKDDAAMQRSLEYTADSIGKADEACDETNEALKEAHKEANKQARAEQMEKIDEKLKESGDKKDDGTTTKDSDHKDTVEISKDGLKALTKWILEKPDQDSADPSAQDETNNPPSDSIPGMYDAKGKTVQDYSWICVSAKV